MRTPTGLGSKATQGISCLWHLLSSALSDVGVLIPERSPWHKQLSKGMPPLCSLSRGHGLSTGQESGHSNRQLLQPRLRDHCRWASRKTVCSEDHRVCCEIISPRNVRSSTYNASPTQLPRRERNEDGNKGHDKTDRRRLMHAVGCAPFLSCLLHVSMRTSKLMLFFNLGPASFFFSVGSS